LFFNLLKNRSGLPELLSLATDRWRFKSDLLAVALHRYFLPGALRAIGFF
jgi:hypothetical protein